MSLVTLLDDLKRLFVSYLDPWDLLSLSLTCKSLYRALRKSKAANDKICYPFAGGKEKAGKLTMEQFRCLAQMLHNPFERKIVVGPVGSGKTWVGISYLFHKYGKELASEIPTLAVMIILPPTCIAQWSDFWKKKVGRPILAIHDASCYFNNDWPTILPKHNIIITSERKACFLQSTLKIARRKFVILQDEIHHGTSFLDGDAIEVIGLTGSVSVFLRRNEAKNAGTLKWEFFQLENTTLNFSVPDYDFAYYDYVGYSDEVKRHINIIISRYKVKFGASAISEISLALNYGFVYQPNIPMMTQRGKKWLRVVDQTKVLDQSVEDYCAIWLSILLNSPKLVAIVKIAQALKERKEKLIVYDTNQNLIVHLYALFKHFNITALPFCTQYNPKERAKLLSSFEKEGDVLIGSIDMLSEAHNITCANNIVFVRYPLESHNFEQAIGRCHRPGQKKKTIVHLLLSCKLEEDFVMMAIERGCKEINIKKHADGIAEFK